MSLPELFERTRRRLRPISPPLGLTKPTDKVIQEAALPGVGKTLPFTMQKQKREEWCWAAVSVSVATFYDKQSAWTQCLLVNEELGLDGCCANVSPDECNQPWYLELGLSRVGHLASKDESSAPFATASAEIDGERPLGCWIVWPDSTGHFVVINGHSTDFAATPPREWVSVQDPKYGSSDYPYLKFLVAYRKFGRWEFSYFTQS